MMETRSNHRHSRPLSNKLMFAVNLGMLVLFLIGMGYFVYQQFNRDTELLQAYPSSLNRPNRFLSFQGRVTDAALNPVTGSTNMEFKLYDSGPSTSGGTELWDSGTCSITPDQDGIINVSLGNDCGSEVSAAVFSENQNVWLEITIGAETLTPRQLIHSVGYALNSETLQGYPASASAVENTVLIMDNSGNVVLGSASPVLQSTGDSFTIEANVLNLTTSSGSNGDIVLDADGLGSIIAQDYLSAPGATISATYAGGTSLVLRGGPSGTANIQEWQNSSGTALSVIDEDGYLGIGTTDPAYALDVNGDIRLALASDLYFGTIGLNDVGTSNTTSGASRIGVYDEFDYSDSTTVQDVLDDLDAQLSGITSLQYYDRVVDPGGEGTDTTIAAAISNASANDVIFITEGTYNENVTINKSLTLIGAGTQAVTVAGSAGSDTIAIADNIDNVIISGLTATNAGTASTDNVIDSAGSSSQTGIIVYDVVLSGGYHGVYLRAAEDSVIARSRVSGSANDGIRIYSSVDNTIAENVVMNAGDVGINIDVNSWRAIVHGNSVNTTTAAGIYLWAATHAAVTNNIVDSAGSDGIVNFQGDFASITGNIVTDPGDEGVVSSTSDFVSVSDNTIDNATSHGLTISSSTYTSVSGNAIDSAGGNGINAISQLNNNITITNNTISSSAAYGIDANGTVDPTDFIISNNIIKNSGTGSYDAPSAGSNFVFANNLTDGDTDISQIEYYPTTGNTFSNDLIQLTLDGADSNSFTGNGLHFIVDQSQFTGYLILGEDDGGGDFFRLSDDGTLYTSGNVGIGNTNPGTKLSVAGLTSTSSFSLVRVDPTTGDFYYDASSQRYKDNIQTLEDDFTSLLDLDVKSYLDIASGNLEIGVIAEDLDELGLTNLVTYKNGVVDGVKYEKIALYNLMILKQHEQRLTEFADQLALDESGMLTSLSERVDDLEAEVDTLKQQQSVFSFTDSVLKFFTDVTFNLNVAVRGKLELNKDTFAEITVPAGSQKIHISFEQPYTQKPSVLLSPQRSIAQSYAIENIGTEGFDVVFSDPLDADAVFTWFAAVSAEHDGSGMTVIETGEADESEEELDEASEQAEEPAPAEPIEPDAESSDSATVTE